MAEKCTCTGDVGESGFVVFDLYGTLVDWKHSIGSFVAFYVSPSAVEDFFACDIREVSSYKPYKSILAKCFREVASKYNVVVSEDLVEAFILSFAKSPPFPDTIYGLRVLKKHGFKVIVLSNTDRDLVETTLWGLRGYVDQVITAEDIKAYKPSLEAFKRTYSVLGVEPGQVVHVSAYPQYDLEPASRLGAKTVLVDRGLGYTWPLRVKNLLELPSALSVLV